MSLSDFPKFMESGYAHRVHVPNVDLSLALYVVLTLPVCSHQVPHV